MVEPGTAAIAVLSTIAGISGYGAMKINSKQADMIEQKVAARIRDTQELLKATQSAKAKAEADLQKQKDEVARLSSELKLIQSAKDTLEKEKSNLASSLQSATEGEQLYKSISLPAFKQAIKDFKADESVRAAQEGLTPAEQAEVINVFDKLESISGLSLSRGSIQSVYQDLTKASGKTDGFMPRVDFDRIFTSVLKGAEANLAAAQRSEKEQAAVKAEQAKQEAEAKKQAEIDEKAKTDPVLAEKLRKKKATKEAETLRAERRARVAKVESELKTQVLDNANRILPAAESAVQSANKTLDTYASKSASKKADELAEQYPSLRRSNTRVSEELKNLVGVTKKLQRLIEEYKKDLATLQSNIRSDIKSVGTLSERLFKGGASVKEVRVKLDNVKDQTKVVTDQIKEVIELETKFQDEVTTLQRPSFVRKGRIRPLPPKTAGVRKSTLKNRRKTIQNDRRTRRSKNRADRTHSHTR